MDTSGLVDNLTISPSILYWMSNSDYYDSWNGMEVDVEADYKITDALTAIGGIAYATINRDEDSPASIAAGQPEDGPAMMIKIGMELEF